MQIKTSKMYPHQNDKTYMADNFLYYLHMEVYFLLFSLSLG